MQSLGVCSSGGLGLSRRTNWRNYEMLSQLRSLYIKDSRWGIGM
jgi:hypothetical protein